MLVNAQLDRSPAAGDCTSASSLLWQCNALLFVCVLFTYQQPGIGENIQPVLCPCLLDSRIPIELHCSSACGIFCEIWAKQGLVEQR